ANANPKRIEQLVNRQELESLDSLEVHSHHETTNPRNPAKGRNHPRPTRSRQNGEGIIIGQIITGKIVTRVIAITRIEIIAIREMHKTRYGRFLTGVPE